MRQCKEIKQNWTRPKNFDIAMTKSYFGKGDLALGSAST